MNFLRVKSTVQFKNVLTLQHIAQFSHLQQKAFSLLLCVNTSLSRNRLKPVLQSLFLKKCRCLLTGGVDSVIMAGDNYVGVKLDKVVAELEAFAPKSLAESWDNVGLLVEPATPKPIKKVLLTIDLTEAVMEEALNLSVDMIISYHPPIFAPLKSVTMRSWKERLIALCLENRIALYSPHTSFDAKIGGVNDWLAAAFENELSVPLIQSFKHSCLSHRVDFTFYKFENVTSDSFLQTLRRQSVDKGNAVRSMHSSETDSMTQLTLECSAGQLAIVTKTFYDLLPENMSSSMLISKVEEEPLPWFGMGRLCELKSPITVKEAVQMVKKHIGIPHLRLALAKDTDLDSKIHSVALCAGSGGSILRGARADLWLTGEMQHHDVLDATQKGSHVILCNHSDSERGYLQQLAPQLSQLFSAKISFLISAKDSDPLKTV